jgi:hypothetical protein
MKRMMLRMYMPKFDVAEKGPDKVWMAYFGYPYTRDPRETSAEARRIARKIMGARNDLILIVPSAAFDSLWEFPPGNTHPELSRIETETIKRCDFFIYEPSSFPSVGVQWEKAIAETLGKPVFTVKEIIEGAKP